jgi:hypothetical protein
MFRGRCQVGADRKKVSKSLNRPRTAYRLKNNVLTLLSNRLGRLNYFYDSEYIELKLALSEALAKCCKKSDTGTVCQTAEIQSVNGRQNGKGAVQFEPPPKGVPSKMPLLIFLPEKYTNIPEAAR